MRLPFTEPFDAKDLLLFQRRGGNFGLANTLDSGTAVVTDSFGGRLGITYADPQTENYWGTFFNPHGFNELNPVWLVRSNDQPLYDVRFNSIGKFEAWRHTSPFESNAVRVATGSAVRSSTALIHFEVRFRSDIAGVLEVWVDGATSPDISISEDTRGPTAAYNTFDNFHIVGLPGSAGWLFDSLYINDTTGLTDNGRGGIVRMLSRSPITDGTDQDWPKSNPGAPSRVSLVNEIPYDGDLSYVYSTVNGQRVSFQPGAHGLTAPSALRAITARHVVRKNTGGQVNPYFLIGGNRYYMGVQDIAVDYQVILDRRPQNPATLADWLLTDVFEVGLETVI